MIKNEHNLGKHVTIQICAIKKNDKILYSLMATNPFQDYTSMDTFSPANERVTIKRFKNFLKASGECLE
jgi:hypothetical protein